MLTILDTINDEEIRMPATGTADEQEVSALSTAVNTALEVVTDPGHFITSPTGFPQFVEKTNFVTSGNQVTDYFLGDSDGDPLSAVATTLYVGTNQIFLYSLSPNIVVGRVGTGTTANASGAIALVLAVEETVTGGFVTAADMWVGLYAPLVHSGTNLIDSADALDLEDLVYLGSDFSTITEIPFENFDGVAPGNNLFNVIFPSDGSSAVQLLLTGSASETLKTVNVSSTGIGAGSQHIDVGATLRIDTVTGMVQANVNSAQEVNQSGNIDYTGRVEIVAADFEVSQVNPSSSPERVDIIISAFNATGAAQEGAYLTNAIASDGVPVQIDAADVRILDDAGNDITVAWLALANTEIIQMGDTVKVVGLNDGLSNSTTDGDRVAFSTDSVPFDRFLITNADPGGTTLDVANIHVTAIQGGSDTEFAELGSHLLFQDDGPTIAAQTNNGADVIHDETPGLTDDDVLGTAFLSGGSGPSVASLFSGVVGGEDPDVAPASGPIGYARSGGSLLTITSGDAGADGPGANPLTYAISVSNGTFSGVETTAGTKVFLYNGSGATAGLILGRVGTENAGGDTANASGTIAFALAVNSATGEVFVAHYLSLLHGTGSNSSFDERISLNTGVLSMSVTRSDSEGDTATNSGNDISLLVKFDDDGPGIAGSPNAGAPNNLEVANTNGASDASSYVLTPGADGLKSFSIVGPANSTGDFTWQYFDVDGNGTAENNEIKGFYKGNELYTLELEDDGTYEFNMIGTLPSSNLALDVTDIKAGGPDTNSIVVGAANDPRSVSIAATGGAINESNDNVGVGNGNLDANEALTFQLLAADGVTALSFQGLSIGTKTASGGTYGWTATLLNGDIITGDDIVVGKNEPIVIGPDELGNVLITSITITKEGGSTTKIGLDDIDIFIPANDVQLGFSVRETDGDNDFVGQTFTVDIDGNLDGTYSSNVNALSAPVASLSSKNPEFVNDAGMAPSIAAVSPTLSFSHHEDYLLL